MHSYPLISAPDPVVCAVSHEERLSILRKSHAPAEETARTQASHTAHPHWQNRCGKGSKRQLLRAWDKRSALPGNARPRARASLRARQPRTRASDALSRIIPGSAAHAQGEERAGGPLWLAAAMAARASSCESRHAAPLRAAEFDFTYAMVPRVCNEDGGSIRARLHICGGITSCELCSAPESHEAADATQRSGEPPRAARCPARSASVPPATPDGFWNDASFLGPSSCPECPAPAQSRRPLSERRRSAQRTTAQHSPGLGAAAPLRSPHAPATVDTSAVSSWTARTRLFELSAWDGQIRRSLSRHTGDYALVADPP